MARDIQTNELLALKEIAEMLNKTNELNPMLNDVLKKLLEVTGFTTGWIFLIDDRQGSSCAASQNLPQALTTGNYALMKGEECACIESYRQNKLDRAVNIIECKRIQYAIMNDFGDTEGITHHATVPLQSGQERFGLLNVATAGKERFSADELDLLQAVALQIGTAINRIRLYQAKEQSAILYAKLGDVIQQFNSIMDAEQFPVKAVEIIGDTFDWPQVSLFISKNSKLTLRSQYKDKQVDNRWRSHAIEHEGLISEAFHDDRLVIDSYQGIVSSDLLAEVGIPPFSSAAAIPLRARNHPIGVLLVSSPKPRQFECYNADFMHSIADHFSLSLENMRIYEQRSDLALMEERNRMARDLHDSVIQKVFSLSFLAKGAETVLAGKEPIVQQSLQEISQVSQEVLKEMRALIWQLRPAGLENGLLPALRQYGQSMDLIIFEQAEGVKELPRAIEESFWRIGQEALNNVRKHSGTNVAYLRLAIASNGASLEISDRGKGFSVENGHNKLTLGMMSMRERAEALGGELTVTSGIGLATTIKVFIPVQVIEEKCDGEKEKE
ncbi:GAF domain-containing sensor histidine kinase [Cohnella lupini]|uniref:histidine kinase n=1 Tax=Cohnella lupini TaxID=1294267 RepID=A0A3D9IX25_9BACL|nr:GAF domain-containing sensor histidine kinase [Cohnella lupini]RED66292.1 hypothetical protein DFP95_101791 [Cohnella lupini]